MKKTLHHIVLAALVFSVASLSSCKKFDDSKLWGELGKHDTRLKELEKWQKDVNDEIVSLKDLVDAAEEGRQVESVTQFNTPAPGGWTITFTSGSPREITINNGSQGIQGIKGNDAVKPVFSVEKIEEVFYWKVDGIFLTDNGGNKIPASGPTGPLGPTGPAPRFKIEGGTLYYTTSMADINWVEIGNIAGGTGPAGPTPSFKIENGKLFYSINDGQSWIDLGNVTGEPGVGSPGDTGPAGPAPRFKIEGGVLYYTTGEGDTGWTSLGTVAGGQGSPGNDGITPKLRINQDENVWEVSLNGDAGPWSSLGGPALGVKGDKGDTGDSMFSSVDNSGDDVVVITLADEDETTITLPKYKSPVSIGIAFEQPEGFMPGSTQNVPFTVSGGAAIVETIGVSGGWNVSTTIDAEGGFGMFTVEAPSAFDTDNLSGKATVLISDGADRLIMRTLEFGIAIERLEVDLATAPVQTKFALGEPFNHTGLKVNIVLPDESRLEIPFRVDDASIDTSTAGTKSVTAAVKVPGGFANPTYDVVVETLQTRIANAPTGTDVMLEVWVDETLAPTTLAAGKRITIKSQNYFSQRTVQLVGTSSMFTLDGQLTLEEIELKGVADNTAALVTINSNGFLIMNDMAGISRNTNITAGGKGGGIFVAANARYLLNRGYISGNRASMGGGIYQAAAPYNSTVGFVSISSNTATGAGGGGIYIEAGNMRLVDGCDIYDNTVTSTDGLGGGVYVAAGATLNTGTATINAGNTIPSGNPVTGEDVYVHCIGSVPGIINIDDATRIGNLCLRATDAARSIVGLGSSPYTGSGQLVGKLDLLTPNMNIYNSQVVVDASNGNLTQAVIDRITLGGLNVVGGGYISLQSRTINPVTGVLSN